MQYKHFPEVNAFVIRNLFSEEECALIMQEQIELMPRYQLPQNTGTAVNKKHLPIKQNIGLFLHQSRQFNTVNITKKILDVNFISTLSSENALYEKLKKSLIANTLISYYRNGDYYAPHVDGGTSPQAQNKFQFTVTHYIIKEPKQFTGGELSLFYKDDSVKNVEIEIENNMTVIFPSKTPHKVNKVSINEKTLSGNSRFCITNFIHEK